MNTLIINGNRLSCEKVIDISSKNSEICFITECALSDVNDTFKDNSNIIVEFEDGTSRDYSEYRILSCVKFIPDNMLEVYYRKLSDVEKLIELHYGGVNR